MEEDVIQHFDLKFDLMLQHFNKYQRLTTSNIERIIMDDASVLEGNDDVLLHGTKGRIIKRNNKPKKMVSANEKNIYFLQLDLQVQEKPTPQLQLLST